MIKWWWRATCWLCLWFWSLFLSCYKLISPLSLSSSSCFHDRAYKSSQGNFHFQMFIFLFSFPSKPSILLSLPFSFKEGYLDDILDPTVLGYPGCYKKQVTRTVTHSKKGSFGQQMREGRNSLIIIHTHFEHNLLSTPRGKWGQPCSFVHIHTNYWGYKVFWWHPLFLDGPCMESTLLQNWINVMM